MAEGVNILYIVCTTGQYVSELVIIYGNFEIQITYLSLLPQQIFIKCHILYIILIVIMSATSWNTAQGY